MEWLWALLWASAFGAQIWFFSRWLRSRLESQQWLKGLRQDVEDLQRELNQVTDRNLSLVEERIAQLNRLIQAADHRLGVLKTEEQRSQQSYAALGRRRPLGAEPDASRTDPVQEGNSGPDPGPALIQAPPSALETPAASKPPDSPNPASGGAPVKAGPMRNQVWELKSLGWENSRISRHLGLSQGELELVLRLGPPESSTPRA